MITAPFAADPLRGGLARPFLKLAFCKADSNAAFLPLNVRYWLNYLIFLMVVWGRMMMMVWECVKALRWSVLVKEESKVV